MNYSFIITCMCKLNSLDDLLVLRDGDQEEDKRLLKIVSMHGDNKDWAAIATELATIRSI